MTFLEFSTQIVATIWALLVLLVWNALRQEIEDRRLSILMMFVNGFAGIAVLSGYLGVLLGVALDHPVALLSVTFSILFILAVVLYYIGLSGLIGRASPGDTDQGDASIDDAD